MFLAVDVHYLNASARVGGVFFSSWADGTSSADLTVTVNNVQPYEPGSFYKRELPCIDALLDLTPVRPTLIVIDGYVDLGPNRAGLGRHLFDKHGIPVVGVAKTKFVGAPYARVSRHGTAPLYVTVASMALDDAAEAIQNMHGRYRIPTILKRADSAARGA